jgi:hypothetical protein
MSVLALAMLIGLNTVYAQAQKIYVDPGRKMDGPVDGSSAHPYPTLASAVAAAPDGSTLVLQGCNYGDPATVGYPETGLLSPIAKKNLKLTAQNGAAQIGRSLGTQRLWQLTGETDLERGGSTPSQTASRFGVLGTDLGSSFEHKGLIYFLFGDTWPSFFFDTFDLRPINSDSIAWIPANADPEQWEQMRLNFITADDGKYLPPAVKVSENPNKYIDLKDYEVPLSGFCANGQMYVFFSTDHYKAQVPCGDNLIEVDSMGRSVLARLKDLQKTDGMFTYLYDASCRPGVACQQPAVGKFINIASVVAQDDKFHDLLQEMNMGEGVLLWGSGKFHESDPYLAFVPLDKIEDRSAWKFAIPDGNGNVSWSNNESDAQELFYQPAGCHRQIGELGVTPIHYLDEKGNKKVKWLMLYSHGDPPGLGFGGIRIHYRVADKPWGPWNGPYILFDPAYDLGYCHFMHVNEDEKNKCDYVADEIPVSDSKRWGITYGAYPVSSFTKTDATTATIYWTMSTWNPYQVMLMKSTLRLSDWRRVDHLQSSR